MRFRRYRAADEAAVLELVNADRILGQPLATAAMLAEALAGRSAVDSSFWAELEPPVTEVLEADGVVSGVVSYAVRRSDRAGVILWMHCREDAEVAAELVAHALGALRAHALDRLRAQPLGPRVGPAVIAFDFASALGLGLEALPVGHRPVTRDALVAAGFAGEDLWSYLHARLPLAGTELAAEVEVRASEEPGRLDLLLVRDGEVLGEATVGEPVDGIGVLWWIAVGVRRQGLGTGLLRAVANVLAERGAREVILYVDDDDAAADRDRSAAKALYARAGFREVDRLWSFKR
ncbi:GNAT family N-acetyltransferase [Kribbella sp. NPDC051770]|uniref:GNAT family N-acetyltransferase n=1 Tax=Kribbella sp. NPDC051770 TaxID=3155413 RepID=UPI00342BC215